MKQPRWSAHTDVSVHVLRAVVFAAATLVGSASSPADPTATLPESGSAVGDYVPQFYTRVVSGPLMNRSVCFVCRYGDRPVVMIVARKVGPEVRPLFKNIDRIVESHRAGGLRSFGVLIADESFPAISSMQTFAFNNRIAMPLTVGTEGSTAEAIQGVERDSSVTVLIYRKRVVAARFVLKSDELDVAHFTPIIDRLKAFATEHAGDKLDSPEVVAGE